MPEILPEQLTGPGTCASTDAPWMTYADEMTEKLSPQLQAEVDDYSTRRHDKSSAQNHEELARQREYNQEIAKGYQWITPDEYADEAPRIGKPMHSFEFINTLRNKCNVRCWYVQHVHPDKVTLKVTNRVTGELDVACWVQLGTMPEYSFMRFDDHGVPVNERKRGWRTCLLQLILKGIVNEQDAERAFGAASGPASKRFRETLFEFRNRGKEWQEVTEELK